MGQSGWEEIVELDTGVIKYEYCYSLLEGVAVLVVIVKHAGPARFTRMRCETVVQRRKVLVCCGTQTINCRRCLLQNSLTSDSVVNVYSIWFVAQNSVARVYYVACFKVG